MLAYIRVQLLRHFRLLYHFFVDHLAFIFINQSFVFLILLLDDLLLLYLKLFLSLFLALFELTFELSSSEFEFLRQNLFDLIDLPFH